jgi:quercetin dioxygenase-like cupin family protein
MQTGVIKKGEGKSRWVVGDLYTFLAEGKDTGETYALIHADVPPGNGPPPHRHHREDEAFYLLEGEMTVHVDGRTIAASPGAWITLPKGTLHSFKNTGTTPARMLILVNPSGLELYFEAVGKKSQAESVTPAAIEELAAEAVNYGLELHLPK